MADANTEESVMTAEEQADYDEVDDFLSMYRSEIYRLEALSDQITIEFFERNPRLYKLMIELDLSNSEEFPTNKEENK